MTAIVLMDDGGDDDDDRNSDEDQDDGHSDGIDDVGNARVYARRWQWCQLRFDEEGGYDDVNDRQVNSANDGNHITFDKSKLLQVGFVLYPVAWALDASSIDAAGAVYFSACASYTSPGK